MKTRTFVLTSILGIFLAFSAQAMTLDEGRTSGAVGERSDGYLEALKSSSDVRSFVDMVNSKRKQEYLRISKENGQPVDIVAKLAAEQIVNKLPAGSSYQAPNGSWKKR